MKLNKFEEFLVMILFLSPFFMLLYGCTYVQCNVDKKNMDVKNIELSNFLNGENKVKVINLHSGSITRITITLAIVENNQGDRMDIYVSNKKLPIVGDYWSLKVYNDQIYSVHIGFDNLYKSGDTK